MTVSDTLTLMGLQLDLAWELPKENRANISRHIAQHYNGESLVILPETFPTGFSMNVASLAEQIDGETYEWMRQLAHAHQTTVMGSVIIQAQGNYFNRMLVVNPSGLLTYYDKRYPFSMSGEDQYYCAGNNKVVFELEGWKIAPMICYDLRFPEWSRNGKDIADRYDLLVYVANWPAKRVAHWEILLQARAIENQAFVVGINRVGKDGNGLSYTGSSMCVDPLGNVIDILKEKEGKLSAKISLSELKNVREKLPFLQDQKDHL